MGTLRKNEKCVHERNKNIASGPHHYFFDHHTVTNIIFSFNVARYITFNVPCANDLTWFPANPVVPKPSYIVALAEVSLKVRQMWLSCPENFGLRWLIFEAATEDCLWRSSHLSLVPSHCVFTRSVVGQKIHAKDLLCDWFLGATRF